MSGKICRWLSLPTFLIATSAPLLSAQTPPAGTESSALPEPQLFAPNTISGPANDGAPTFSPDGNTLYFTVSAAHWTVIAESHKLNGTWSRPTLAPFSGEWPDSSPAMSPDGSFIVFQSSRPTTPLTTTPKLGEPIPGIISNLWRVNRTATGWSTPERLPAAVNVPGQSIWKPSIAADATIYLTAIDAKGSKRLYASQLLNGAYQPAQPLSFSDGTTQDVDPEIAPDGSFLVFCSAGRMPGDSRDHLFLVRKNGDAWGTVTPLRYAGDLKPYGSTDDEPRLSPDHRTLYFSSDRAIPVHFPRKHDQAIADLDRLQTWDNSNANIWSISLDSVLRAA